MGGTRQLHSIHHGGRWTPLSQWLVIVAAVLGLATTDGRLAATSFAAVAPIVRSDLAAAPAANDSSTGATVAPVERPDFRADVVGISTGQAGQLFSYTVQVRNAGGAAGSVRVSTILPPEFSNVRVNAPGFACTRQFSASGAQAGTVVTCTRNMLKGGATADVTVEANAPSVAGEYRLIAAADPRDDVAAADEANNQIVTLVRIIA
jgi:hypothetical protein